MDSSRRKKPKTLSGIETQSPISARSRDRLNRRKKPKTLSGIETMNLGLLTNLEVTAPAGKNLKPYQGLKRLPESSGITAI